MSVVRQQILNKVEVPRASVVDTLRIGAVVLAPAIARGVLARRPKVVALAEKFDADRHAGKLMQRMRARYGSGPLRLAVPGRSLAMVLTPDDVRRVLTGSPEPFAAANLEKRKALEHFQPHGVLISHGADRADRRRFNEEVLDTHHDVHCQGAAIAEKVHQEAAGLLAAVDRTGALDWDAFRIAWWRVIRRVVLGDAARDDSEISDLLTTLRMNANWSFAHPRRDRVRHRFQERLREHLARAEPGSLAELVARAPATERTVPADQVPQWLFAFEPAGMAVFRALAVLAARPSAAGPARDEVAGLDLSAPQDLPYLRACVQESVRLWPTTLAVLRDSTTDTEWEGRMLPAGTGLIIHTPSLQRDEQNLSYADDFAPGAWLDGRAEADWSAIPFSGGPVECPGRNLVLLVTSLFLGALLQEHDFRLVASGRPLTEGAPLPRTLGAFGLRFGVSKVPVKV
ncbi:cytochrome P450 [Actinomadura hibisca]|uniref:cytochrome P450 n=1 Tax=Actinomadura hibisca TaxID=68565 RepID=UPI000AD5509D|nr:cytochrome P450 [Actinomadura hibisca]